MLQVLLIIVTVLMFQLNSVVLCRSIPIANPAVQSPKIQNVQLCTDAFSTDDPFKGSSKSGITMGYPANGTGLFRNPLEVLGTLFPTSKSINICEILITLQADVASNIRFSERGRKMCSEVCRQYQKNMMTNGPVDVNLLQGYCDYSNNGDTIDQTDLATTCTCVYRVGCNNKTSMVLYTFQTNSEGYLKVLMSEPNKSQPIT